MGRSVSYPSGASVAFAYREPEGEYCSNCGHAAAQCDCPPDEQDLCPTDAYVEWEDYVEELREGARDSWPSMRLCSGWIGNEDRILAENAHAYFGVSEYMDLVAVWLVPKDCSALSAHWIKQATPKLLKNFATLQRIGTMSNGVSVFRKIEGKAVTP